MEGGKVHDYCGRTHAQKHKSMMEEIKRQMIREHRVFFFSNNLTGIANGMFIVFFFVCLCWHYKTYTGGNLWSRPFDHADAPIRFYNRDAPYYEFTNFYPAEVDLDGQVWPTTEHYFQAQKFIGTPFVEIIRNFPRPREAFDFSRNPAVSCWCRADWEQVKINIMRKALLAKFSQHCHLRQKLLQTGTRKLIEHSPYDNFWGNGGDDRGLNHLGGLLMEIRDEICKIRMGESSQVPQGVSVEKDKASSSTPTDCTSESKSVLASSDHQRLEMDPNDNQSGQNHIEAVAQVGDSNLPNKQSASVATTPTEGSPDMPSDGEQSAHRSDSDALVQITNPNPDPLSKVDSMAETGDPDQSAPMDQEPCKGAENGDNQSGRSTPLSDDLKRPQLHSGSEQPVNVSPSGGAELNHPVPVPEVTPAAAATVAPAAFETKMDVDDPSPPTMQSGIMDNQSTSDVEAEAEDMDC